MKKLQKLYEEITLRDTRDLTARAMHVLASATGSLKRALPAEEPTTPEFISFLDNDKIDSIEEFLDYLQERKKIWQDIPSGMVGDNVVNLAEKYADGILPFPGGEHKFDSQIDWHCAFNTDKSWPRDHWSEIPFRRLGMLGDIKNCWDVNRHQYFPALALAYIKTGNEEYLKTVEEFIQSWCDQNTPETGIHYISNLEMAFRTIAWHFTDLLLEDMSPAVRERLHKNMYAQARHIATHIGYTEKTGRNNHLIGDAAALAFLSITHPEWKNSNSWLKKASTILWPALEEQVMADGLHFECSFGYHVAVTEFILLLACEMQSRKLPIPPSVMNRLEKMIDVIKLSRQPDGTLPNINDNDNGYVIPLPLDDKDRISGILSVGSILFNRADFKAAAGGTSLYTLLLLGEKGIEDFYYIPTHNDKPQKLTILKNSGLGILRQDKNFCLIKNNPDPFPYSGHNHADLLGITLIMNDEEILCDAGTFRYNADGGFRNALRSTCAHNTIAVDKKPQASPHRNFGWTSRTQNGFIHGIEGAGFTAIDANHESYANLGCTHRRLVMHIEATNDMIIIDRMSGTETHYFEQYWHFAPDTILTETAEHRYQLSRAGKNTVHIRFFRENHHDHHDITFGTDRNKTSYVSQKYGEAQPAKTLKHSWTSTLQSDHSSHRITVFSQNEYQHDITDEAHGIFIAGAYRIDLGQIPAVITKIPASAG